MNGSYLRKRVEMYEPGISVIKNNSMICNKYAEIGLPHKNAKRLKLVLKNQRCSTCEHI